VFENISSQENQGLLSLETPMKSWLSMDLRAETRQKIRKGVGVRDIGDPEYQENVASGIAKLRNAISRQANSVGPQGN
jgi:hypothetical protein